MGQKLYEVMLHLPYEIRQKESRNTDPRVVNSGEMPPDIDQTVLSRRHLFEQLVFGEILRYLVPE